MQELSEETIGDVLGSLQYATEAAKGWAKAWHNWALFNVQVGSRFWVKKRQKTEKTTPFGINLMRSQVLHRAAQAPD